MHNLWASKKEKWEMLVRLNNIDSYRINVMRLYYASRGHKLKVSLLSSSIYSKKLFGMNVKLDRYRLTFEQKDNNEYIMKDFALGAKSLNKIFLYTEQTMGDGLK